MLGACSGAGVQPSPVAVGTAVTPDRQPQIIGITARNTRTDRPSGFANAGDEILLTATVKDDDLPPSGLSYRWTSNAGGTFSSAGAATVWQAPYPSATPSRATLTLSVTAGETTRQSKPRLVSGPPPVQASVEIRLHDSVREIGEMARQFLLDFSHSRIRDVPLIMRNFSAICARGKAEETDQVTRNRQNFTITTFSVGEPSVTVRFGGACPFRFRAADACAQIPVEWTSTILSDDTRQQVAGTDQVTAVYEAQNDRWALCESDFDGRELVRGQMRGFIR